MLEKSSNKIRLFVALLAVCAALVFGAGCSAKAEQAPVKTEAAAAKEAGEDLLIPVSGLTEEPQFYPYSVNGKDMEIIALTASDGSVRTAFNTCQVCYSSGNGYYKVKGDTLVCQNCGNQFGFDEIALTRGGCNPVPITEEERKEQDGNLVISADYLGKASQLFANWK